MKVRRYRLPGGKATASRKDYLDAWASLADACAAKFGPGWVVLQCDPDVVLAGMATTVRLPVHAALCLARKA